MSALTITLIVINILSITLNFYLVYLYTGKIKDEDKDMIADAAEEAVVEIQTRAKRVVQEMKDVGAAVKEVGNQLGDIPAAAAGKTRTGRKKK
jgi:hypothetical protein